MMSVQSFAKKQHTYTQSERTGAQSFLLLMVCLMIFVGLISPLQAQSPVAWWKFDEGTGTRASNSAGGGFTGTLQSTAGWATGLVGPYALNVTGASTSYVDVASAVVNTTQSYTVMGWVNLTTISGYQTFVSIDGTQVSGFYLQLRGDTGKFALAALASDATGTAIEANATAPPAAGEWYHVAGVYDATAKTISLYVNGTLQQTTPYTSAWRATGHTEIGRGKYGGSSVDFVGGQIDDVRFYNSALSASAINAIAQANLPPPYVPTLTINAGTIVASVSPTFYGMMTEEINHSYDGGVYGELVQNRIFQDSTTSPIHWSEVQSSGAAGTIALDTTQPINTALTTCLNLTATNVSGSQRVGAANDGFWGIPVTPLTTYQASFWAKSAASVSGPLTVDIESSDGSVVYATAQIPSVTNTWQQYSVALTTGNVVPSETTRFVVSTGQPGTFWFNLVSLFPPTYNNRANGNRPDLMQKMAGLRPSFLRLPGGNYLEGNTIATRFEWKNTIGPLSGRAGHMGTWSYRSSDGMGLLEFLEWCEDLNIQPVLAVYAGYSLNGTHVVPGTALQPYVQDALDEIQYVTGDQTTTWGAVRAADGHPAPFPLTYVEIGNEDFFDSSGSYSGSAGRYGQFYDAIKASYPSLQLIATSSVSGHTMDVLDDHYYKSPSAFEADVHHYDSYSRTGTKIFVGEWASQEGTPTPDMNSALGDAAWLTGMEHNSDLIVLESYAPMLVNVNSGASQWGTNLIGYDALTSYGSPSYYVQSLFAANHGDSILGGTLKYGSQLYYSATRDSSLGYVYLKVVNTAGTPQLVHLTLSGLTKVLTGLAYVLTSGSPTDTNTLTNPTAVYPTLNKMARMGTTFDYTFAPYSVTVLKIQAR